MGLEEGSKIFGSKKMVIFPQILREIYMARYRATDMLKIR